MKIKLERTVTMKKNALILTGGDAERMRPAADNVPKALLPVCNKPLIDYTVGNLIRYGYSGISVAADRRSDRIAKHLADLHGTELIFSSLPCGSCLPVARAAKNSEGFITVVFGDVLFDFDLSAAENFHIATGADITIVTKIADCPSAHAVAEADENNRIISLTTDYAHESCRSDLAVTGIFIIDAAVAAEAEEYSDLLEDFLPSFISRGKVMNFTADGFFLDINTPEDLFAASEAVFSGQLPTVAKPSVSVLIAASAQLAEGVKIGSGTAIGENVTICRGAEINGSIISDGAYIGERVRICGGFIGNAARLLSGAEIRSGAIIGDGAVIGEQAVVQSGVRISSGARLDSYSCAKADTGGVSLPLRITDDGICGETGAVITPQTAALTGSAVASLGGKIGIACRDNSASEGLALALASGVAAAGAEAWFFGKTSEPALCYCSEKAVLSACCYVDAGITAKIRIFSGDGLPLSRREEKLVENGLGGNFRKAAFNRFGRIKDVSSMTEAYVNMLEKTAPVSLSGIRAVLNTSGSLVSCLCEEIIGRINCKDGSPVVFHLGSNGRGVSAYTDETGYVFEEKLILICCNGLFMQGRNVSLPCDFPAAAERLAQRYARRVFRYSLCPSDESDREARQAAVEDCFVRDGAALIFTVLKILEDRGISLAEALSELPESAVCTRFVPVDRHPLKLLKDIGVEKRASGDGITLTDNRGQVFIRPVKTEKGILMQAESFSTEAASELCDFYQDLISSRLR